MKRIINLTLLFSVVLMFACGSTTGKQSSATSEPKPGTANGKPIQLDKQTFLTRVYNYEKFPDKWVYAGDKPCVIDFYADWCGPCKMIAPYLEEIAGKYSGKVYVYKVNVDAQQELAQYFGIQSIPAVLICPLQGKPTMMTGANPKEEYYKAVETIMGLKKN
ncbi:MAG: thioredoxin [Bacteroidota bacterium]|nr:thioredoxin [Bacteroidota bacterium]